MLGWPFHSSHVINLGVEPSTSVFAVQLTTAGLPRSPLPRIALIFRLMKRTDPRNSKQLRAIQ